jgi:hypothetical protein
MQGWTWLSPCPRTFIFENAPHPSRTLTFTSRAPGVHIALDSDRAFQLSVNALFLMYVMQAFPMK